LNNFINKFANFIVEGIEIDKVKTEEMSEKQLEWIADPYLCAACGSRIEDYFSYCEECGIKLDRKPKKSPFNFTKYKNYELKYIFKPKKGA